MQEKSFKGLKACKKTSLLGGNMKPKTSESQGHQLELGAVLFSFINMKDALVETEL
ncbi:MAG: hypothetical protein OXB86_03575 [Bdellovibrionales bacterium]|nr:hypothetical protein [Bdellovibrionales bacterium]